MIGEDLRVRLENAFPGTFEVCLVYLQKCSGNMPVKQQYSRIIGGELTLHVQRSGVSERHRYDNRLARTSGIHHLASSNARRAPYDCEPKSTTIPRCTYIRFQIWFKQGH